MGLKESRQRIIRCERKNGFEEILAQIFLNHHKYYQEIKDNATEDT